MWLMVHLGWKGDSLRNCNTAIQSVPLTLRLPLPCDPVPHLWTFPGRW